MSEMITQKKEFPRVLVEVGIAWAGGIGLALLSQVAIPLPWTPIPVTLQTLGVFLLGGLLGSQRGFYSVLAYLIQGCWGLPVFAGGVSNPLWICGLQAGFLISFLGAAYLIGKILEESPYRFLPLVLGLVLGQLLMWGIGGLWMACYVGFKKAFLWGILPFFTGAVFKITVGAFLIQVGRRAWR